ncbi:hypothetical protein BZA77DRAFT_358887 [Pyronema omphalodes]|nr:hypothetical protein BZA77DRAFT_358887 [Pyronema omphalodes]
MQLSLLFLTTAFSILLPASAINCLNCHNKPLTSTCLPTLGSNLMLELGCRPTAHPGISGHLIRGRHTASHGDCHASVDLPDYDMYFSCEKAREAIDAVLAGCGNAGGGVDNDFWGLKLDACGTGRK